ncbi:MAG TPA: beta-propeller domain-containing protein [Allosphingosinicella sp.]|nr:beta-propeller domain-containing protein [Allosphingosinicella sp.]
MGTPLLLGIAVAIVSLACTASTVTAQPKAGATSRAPSGPGLTAFQSNDALRAYLRRLRQRSRAGQVEAEAVPMPSPPSPVAAADAAQGMVTTTAARTSTPSITNTQEANVDEGGIVKVSGDTLVILRRGRLFTVSLAGGRMRPVDSINAFPPGVSGEGDWYDEMLLSGDRVVVVGYSYARGGTEINRFRLDPAGKLRFEDAYHLRSNDYYSSRNYASRLIGNRLIFYTPLYLDWRSDPLEALPGIRRWRPGSTDRSFTRIASARQIYIPPAAMDGREAQIDTLHSVTTCDLTAPVLDCSAIGVLGPASRTFYVSGRAVYLWMSDYSYDERRAARSYIYRLPLGNERPSAIGARGAPIDQFSFREDPGQNILNILVRAEGTGGDSMWRPEVTAGDVALLRIPIAEFGNGSREAGRARYRSLPKPEGDSWSFHNRFVGDHVLYGAGTFGGRPGGSTLFVVPLRGGAVARLAMTHAVDRIEALGRDAMGVGSSPSGLGFTAVELAPGQAPRIGDNYTLPNAAEGESRSHAFFFSPDPVTPDGASGILGLPVARQADPAYRRFFGSAAAMLYLRRLNRQLSPAGELAARVEGTTDDGCTASCVDWYGNARPIFLPPRTFALLGYELVEGELERGRIREVGRVNFSPPTRRNED